MEIIPLHEAATLFPSMVEEEYRSLVADIAANGQLEPIVLHNGQIIDGRHRYNACCELKIEPKFKPWNGNGSITQYVISQNLRRRHLSASQRAAVAVQADEMEIAEIEAHKRMNEAAIKGGHKSGEVRRPRMNPVARLPQGSIEQPSIESNDKEIFPQGSISSKCKTHEVVQPTTVSQKARETVAHQFGASARYVQDAKKIRNEAPELLDQVKTGARTIPQVKQELRRRQKREELKTRAQDVLSNDGNWEIRTGDCVELLPMVKDRARLIFADPPYNIGVNYGGGKSADLLPDDQYMAWVEQWLVGCRDMLTDDGSMWILIGDEYAAEYSVTLKRLGLTVRSWIKWFESFGVNCSRNFNRCSRHIFYCVRDPNNFVFHEDAVSRLSDRQTKYADKRAAETGKLWDNIWGIDPPIPRLTGTCNERVPDFPTQLPLKLLTPIVLCASDPGDLIIDPFNGSGTTGVAAIQNGRRYIGIEKSAQFAELATMRLKGVQRG